MTTAVNRWSLPPRRELVKAIVAQKYFRDLPAADVDRIAALVVSRRYRAGELIHCKLDPAAGLYGILRGRVRISSASAEGRESVFSFLGAGEWFGYISLIDGLPRTHDIRAVEDSLILIVPHDDFRGLLEEHPILYKHLALQLCGLIREAFSTIDDDTLLGIETRLAKRLVALADSQGATHPEGVLINHPQHELALMLNVTRQTVNRKLAEWRHRGWISIHYGKIIIVRRDELERLFGGSHNTAPSRHGTNSWSP